MKSDWQRDKGRTIVCVVCGTKYHPFRSSRGKCCTKLCAGRLVGLERAKKFRAGFAPPPPVRGARWVPLSSGRFVLVDAKDYERVAAFPWSDDGRSGKHVFPGRRSIRLHRFILGVGNGVQVDHRDGDQTDNRRSNLRAASSAQNTQNRRKVHRLGPPKSKYKCVWLHPHGWTSIITAFGKRKYLGLFKTQKEAALAHDVAARKMHGRFARLNFPRKGERSALR